MFDIGYHQLEILNGELLTSNLPIVFQMTVLQNKSDKVWNCVIWKMPLQGLSAAMQQDQKGTKKWGIVNFP